jgi:hypothetical protein
VEGMLIPFGAPLVLLAVAAIFFVLVVRDRLMGQGNANPARKAWLRVALIFSTVAIVLIVLNSVND